jgi:hypothetical protein
MFAFGGKNILLQWLAAVEMADGKSLMGKGIKVNQSGSHRRGVRKYR